MTAAPVRAFARWCLPPLVAAAPGVFGRAPYAAFLVAATAVTRNAAPLATEPVAVRAVLGRIHVHTGKGVDRLDAGAVGWPLAALVCLWGWAVGRRWLSLAALFAAFVLLQVAVTDIQVRIAMGEGSGWPYAFVRAWYLVLAPALPVACAALGHVLGRRRALAGDQGSA